MIPLVLALLAASPIPKPLIHLESATEDLGEQAQLGHWERAGSLLAGAERDAQRLRGQAAPAPLQALQSALAEARSALRAHDRWAVAYAANRGSAEVVRLYAPLHPVVPTDVMQLDVLLREAQLDGLTGAAPKASSALEQSLAVWSRLRESPPLRGTATSRHFQAQLSAVEQAVRAANGPELASSAARALEGVDSLESVFEKAAKGKK